MRRCPICTVKIPESTLMCWQHWDMVPEDRQKQVTRLCDVATRGPNSSIRRMAMEEYRQAREAAIAAVKSQLEGQT